MMWLLWTLLAIFLLGCIPLGIRAKYEEDLDVWVTVLGIPIHVYPGKPKDEKPKEKKQEEAPKKKRKLPPVRTLLEYLQLLWELLGALRRRIRVRRLKLHAVFGGRDEADAALNYGRAWAAIGAVTPLLEACFRIKKRDVGAFMGDGEKTVTLLAEVHATLTVGRILQLALSALWRFIKIYKKDQPEKAV